MKKIIFLITLFLIPNLTFGLSDKIYKELETFTRIIDIVDKDYVEEVDEEKMIQGAIQGLLYSLDPHSVYLPQEMYRDFKSDTTGKYGGIGVEITVKDGILTVVTPFEDSPAHHAGIKPGDRILKVDGVSTKGMTLMDAVHSMRGPRGKKVMLTIWREGRSSPIDVAVNREVIKMSSVKKELIEKGVAYVRITSFQEKTGEALKTALEDLKQQSGGNLQSIVLDLRNNPGGLFSEAVYVSDLFLNGGVIVSTRGRSRNQEIKKAKKNNSPFEDIPMVVLINRGSASAAEIVAGALQDTKRAKILGTQSFGKGSVQTLFDMGNKSALKLTIARYYTPRGRSIDGKGIDPDITIGTKQYKLAYPKKDDKNKPSLKDYQKQKAIDYLKNK